MTDRPSGAPVNGSPSLASLAGPIQRIGTMTLVNRCVSFPAGAKRRGREPTPMRDATDPRPALRAPEMTAARKA
jgi:hypothetical protein